MAYATPQDMIDRFDGQMLKQITDPDVQTIDTVKLQRALDDASNEIDAYLEARYKLPFGDPPAILKVMACNIALYQLLVLRPLGDMEDQRKRYEDATKFLTKVAEGTVQLGLSGAASPAPHTEGPVVQGPDRTFSRDSMKGF